MFLVYCDVNVIVQFVLPPEIEINARVKRQGEKNHPCLTPVSISNEFVISCHALQSSSLDIIHVSISNVGSLAPSASILLRIAVGGG